MSEPVTPRLSPRWAFRFMEVPEGVTVTQYGAALDSIYEAVAALAGKVPAKEALRMEINDAQRREGWRILPKHERAILLRFQFDQLPTPDQVRAVEAFREKYGSRRCLKAFGTRDWREALGYAWADGRDEREPQGGLLRQIRNDPRTNTRWLQVYDR